MKHGKKTNHLGRKVAHRKSMLANMASSLIEHKRISTTLAKAKSLKQFVEPIITKSKNDTTHNRRLAFSELRNKYAVAELFREVAQKVGDRPGGYTRVIKMGNRLGDNASMAMIELVDFNEVYNNEKGAAKKSTRRSRSRKQVDSDEASAPNRLADKQSTHIGVEETPAKTSRAKAKKTANTDGHKSSEPKKKGFE
jgi:large subunit ribosomal protein L17